MNKRKKIMEFKKRQNERGEMIESKCLSKIKRKLTIFNQ